MTTTKWPYTYNQSLVDASSCLFRFKRLRDRARKTDSQSVVSSTGTAIHAFARKYHEHCWKSKVQTDIEAWAKIAAGVLVGSGLRDQDKEDFLHLAEGFVNAEMVPGSKGDVLLEATLKSADGRLFGTPDRVISEDGGALVGIDDWKSYRRMLPLSECKRRIQLPWYGMLCLDKFPKAETFRLRFLFLRFAKDQTWVLSRAEVEEFRERMVARCDELDALTEFPAKGGADCEWCDLPAACPLVKAGDIRLIGSDAEARSTAERLCAVKAQEKELTARLKGWVEKSEKPVEVEGAVLDFHPSRSMRYDVATVGRAYKALGVKLESVLAEASIAAAGIKRVGKTGKVGKEDVAAILAGGEEKVTTRFGFKKTGGDDGDGEDE